MVFFLRLVNIFPSGLLGVSFVLWWPWLFALFVCFWASSVEALQKGPRPGDKRVCVLLFTGDMRSRACSCAQASISLGAGFRDVITFSEKPTTPERV